MKECQYDNIMYFISQYLKATERRLETQGIHSPLIDAEVLMSVAINRPREFLYAHPEYEMTDEEIVRYDAFISRRCNREPVAYITGKKEFYGLNFFVNDSVLIPRPETEEIVENTLAILKKSSGKCAVIDVGTGSGCIIIAIAKTSLMHHYYAAVDISIDALNIARENANQHGVQNKIAFFHGNLIEPILNAPQKKFDAIIIAANLPYITPAQYKTLEPEIVRYEPGSALLTPTDDSYYYYRELEKQTEIMKKIYSVPIYRLYETDKGIQKIPINLSADR